MKLTARTITDDQIHDLLVASAIDDRTYCGALLVLSQHGTLGRQVRRESRAYCAAVFNAREKRHK